MDEQNKAAEEFQTPPQTASTDPATIVVSQQTASDNKPKGNKKLLVILIAILVLLGLGAGAWYLFKPDEKKQDSAVTPVATATDTDENIVAEPESPVLKTATYTSLEQYKASIQYPEAWKLDEFNDSIGETMTIKRTVISAPSGLRLTLGTVYGKGGSCDPNTTKYTLVKKVPTATDNMFFTEYKADNFPALLMFEDMTASAAAHKDLKEGESGTDTCQLPSFSNYGDMYLSVTTTQNGNADEGQTYEQITATSPNFIAMLKTVKLTK